MHRAIILLAILFTSSSVAGAASLHHATGDVLVNTGRGFERAQIGQSLKPGDRLMIGRGGGEAIVSYDLSCIERVESGRVTTVQAGIPCGCSAGSTDAKPASGRSSRPARLVSVAGDVLVSSSGGQSKGREGQALRTGDSIAIGAGGGSATITYEDACDQRVEVGRSATVQNVSPCACGAGGQSAMPSTIGGIPAGALIAGGAAVAVGVGVGISNSSSSGARVPSSP